MKHGALKQMALSKPEVGAENEVSATIQDVATRETLVLLKVLALGDREIEQGKVKPVAGVVSRLHAGKAAD